MSSHAMALSRSVGVLAVVVLVASVGIAGCKRVAPPTRAAPIRAAFYYPWFPEAWNQSGQNPFTAYAPSRGLYSTDIATVRTQIPTCSTAASASASRHGSVRAPRPTSTGRRSCRPRRVRASAGRRTTSPRGSPTRPAEDRRRPSLLVGDDTERTDSGLLYVNGKGMAVFVYNADATRAKGCDTVRRWARARRLLGKQHHESSMST